MMWRKLAASLVVLALLWAPSPVVGQGNEGGTGELTGSVAFLGDDCAPGYGRVPPCTGPYPGYEIVVYQADGTTEAGRTTSDDEGEYEIELPAGQYVIYTPAGPGFTKANPATLVSGETTQLDLVVDTGMM